MLCWNSVKGFGGADGSVCRASLLYAEECLKAAS